MKHCMKKFYKNYFLKKYKENNGNSKIGHSLYIINKIFKKIFFGYNGAKLDLGRVTRFVTSIYQKLRILLFFMEENIKSTSYFPHNL